MEAPLGVLTCMFKYNTLRVLKAYNDNPRVLKEGLQLLPKSAKRGGYNYTPRVLRGGYNYTPEVLRRCYGSTFGGCSLAEC